MTKPELFYDTETTGFPTKADWADPSQPHVIQLGWILSTEDRVLSEGNVLIKPATEDWEMNPKAEAVHGISMFDVMLYGVPAEIVAKSFNYLLMASGVRVCHNTRFDQKLMTTLFKRHGLNANLLWDGTYCTMLNTTELCKLPGNYGKHKWPTLQELHEHLFDCKFEGAHDALEDVRATRRCYYELKRRNLL